MAFSSSGAESGAAAGTAIMPGWGTVIGGIAGGLMGGSGEQAAKDASAAQLALERQMYEQQDPFSAGGNRAQYVPQLNALMQGGPGGVQNDPNFQKMSSNSLENIQRQSSAGGQGIGTNNLLAMQQGQFGLQQDYFNQQYTKLAQLSGVGAGRTTLHGESPQLAGEMAQQTAANRASGLGMLFGGVSQMNFGGMYSSLKGIFGGGTTSTSSSSTSGQD